MMCKNYESVAFPHRLVGELLPTLFSTFVYHPEIPNGYAESITALKALYVAGDEVIATVSSYQVYWPGYNAQRLRFNAATGAFVTRDPMNFSVGYAWSGDITQGANNQLYITSLGDVYRCDDDYQTVGTAIDPALYDENGFDVYYFDEMRNRALLRPYGATNLLKVCEFQSGTLLWELLLPSIPEQIVSAGGSSVYILMRNKGVLGIDYISGRTFSYTKIPQIDNPVNAFLAWNPTYQRMLVCEWAAANIDGTSPIRIYGYRNVPIATRVCKPIPLKRLRKGVKSPLLIKQIGDFGEGIAGVATITSSGAAGTITRQIVELDGDGEGLSEIYGDDAGTENVTVTVEVACLL